MKIDTPKHISIDVYLCNRNEYAHAGAVIFNEAEGVKGFTYAPAYKYPPIDPINLNYITDGNKIFNLDKNRVLYEAIRDTLPGKFASRMIATKYPEYKNFDDIERLWWIGSRTSNGLKFLAMERIGRPKPARSLQELESFSVEVNEIESGAKKALSEKYITEMRLAVGGARKKWRIIDKANNEWIVKFNESHDVYNSAKVEQLGLRFMREAKIKVPDSRVLRISETEECVFIKRFDVDKFSNKQHKISLAALVGRNTGADYSDIVEKVSAVSITPEHDLRQLFRSMMTDVLFHNSDNHLRNFEMLLFEEGYRLSPQYDKLPDYSQSPLTTHCCGYHNADITDNRFLKRAANIFGIPLSEATVIRSDTVRACMTIPAIATAENLSDNDLSYVINAIAIGSPDLANALKDSVEKNRETQHAISIKKARPAKNRMSPSSF